MGVKSKYLCFLVALTLAADPAHGNAIEEREGLTGDWGGARSKLDVQGLAFEALYTTEVFGNLSGGRSRKVVWQGNFDLMVTWDLEYHVGWPGARLFVYGVATHGGNPTDFIGDLQGASNIEAPDMIRLYEFWLRQELFSGRLAVLVGLYDLNSELEVIPSAGLFVHSSFGMGPDFGLSGKNGPSVFPNTGLGARVEFRPLESVYLRAVLLDGVPGNTEHPTKMDFRWTRSDGLLFAAEVGFVNNPVCEVHFEHAGSHLREPRPTEDGLFRRGNFGKYAIGVWGYTTALKGLQKLESGESPVWQNTLGAYLFGEQSVYHEATDESQGLSVFMRVGLADGRVNPVNASLGGGLVYRGPFPGRRNDRVGVAVTAAHLSKAYRHSQMLSGDIWHAWEIAGELSIALPLVKWFAIQTSLEIIHHPGGDPSLDTALAMAVRARITL